MLRYKAPMAIMALCFSLVSVSCSCQPQEPAEEPPASSYEIGPGEILDAFVMALENGDVETAIGLVMNDQQEPFAEVLRPLSRDDIIAVGLQFREERYQPADVTDDTAVFWSESASLYLVLTYEDDIWKIDPHRTDVMNADRNE